jgi:hypothetical protein
LETKHNVTILWYIVMQFLTRRHGGATSFSTLPTKKSFLFFLYLWFVDKKQRWQ